ncbi:MAG TPA: 2OG-Fe(II) oxygenase [Acidobacteriaceae bacterium]|nr:2OG-Fe(II) oxygenase [Acidobacteriaceae bacterium]
MTHSAIPNPLRPGISFGELAPEFRASKPFNNIVIDNFLTDEAARAVAAEFPSYEGPVWNEYNNAIEVKKAYNHWDKFPPATYKLFAFLNSPSFTAEIAKLCGGELYSDPGLHGGGWHSHGPGGKLNMHLDYSIHPKIGLERRINLILYVQPEWKPEWGGALGFWENDETNRKPGALAKQIDCLFNRAVIFDTSQNSWHGLPDPVACPPDKPRNSLAVYYLCEPRQLASDRGRALFAPTAEQANDPSVLDLIEKRSKVATSAGVYRQSWPSGNETKK